MLMILDKVSLYLRRVALKVHHHQVHKAKDLRHMTNRHLDPAHLDIRRVRPDLENQPAHVSSLQGLRHRIKTRLATCKTLVIEVPPPENKI